MMRNKEPLVMINSQTMFQEHVYADIHKENGEDRIFVKMEQNPINVEYSSWS